MSSNSICLPISAEPDRGPEEDPRFVVNYHLFSTKHYNRLRLKVRLSEDDPHVANSNGHLENGELARAETFDLLGIIFDGHPGPAADTAAQ
jgi:NADH-quinone oxidoreductase subunit C